MDINSGAAPSPSRLSLNIVVLEDNEALRESVLLPTLRESGFRVTGVGTAAELYRCMLHQMFDIVLLDIGLPDENGLDVVRHLRQVSFDIGIVMLTGARGRDKRMRALNDGADAFLTKPVDGEVLVATLLSLARRLSRQARQESHSMSAPPPDAAAGGGRWRLDASGWCLIAPNGAMLALTVPERRLLGLLIEAGGQPVPRDVLLEALAGGDRDFDPHRLEMLVYRLRRKAANLGRAGEPLPLLASRGVGYLFTG